MSQLDRLKVMSRDPDLTHRGYLTWRKAEITLSWLGVASWSLTLDASPANLTRLDPAWGVIIGLDGTRILTGSIEEDGPREWSADGGDRSGPGEVTVSGACDLAIVAGELAYPNPARAATAQDTDSHDKRAGAAESVIKGYVADNIGTGRATARRDPSALNAREVVVAPDQGRGEQVSHQARFAPLMDVVRACSGGLGVRVTQQGAELVFETIEPRDLTRTARFSRQLGNLRSARWQRSMPTATHVVVAGQGEGEQRTFRERSDPATADSWRQITRVFKDQRNTDDSAELDAAGDKELADARRAAVLEADLVDTARLRVHPDTCWLGDWVTVEPLPGVAFVDQVTQVRITADAESGDLAIRPTVGRAVNDVEDTEQERLMRQLEQRVAQLERAV